MTDRQTDRTTQWCFTAYEQHYDMIDSIVNDIIAHKDPNFRSMDFQSEICPDTGRPHRQGVFVTFRQHRFQGIRQPPKVLPRPRPNPSLMKLMPGVHIEPAWDWLKSVQYIKKKASRDLSGVSVSAKSDYAPKQLHELLTDFARIYLELTAPKDCSWCELPEHKCLCTRHKPDVTYWDIANVYLRTHPELCGLVGQPLPQNLWKNTRAVWLDRAISITPGPPGPPNEILSSSYVSNAVEEASTQGQEICASSSDC